MPQIFFTIIINLLVYSAIPSFRFNCCKTIKIVIFKNGYLFQKHGSLLHFNKKELFQERKHSLFPLYPCALNRPVGLDGVPSGVYGSGVFLSIGRASLWERVCK